MIDKNCLVPMNEANQDFSKVIRIVDESGMAVISEDNKPKYLVVDFEEYEEIFSAIKLRKERIETTADEILSENMEAFLELAK